MRSDLYCHGLSELPLPPCTTRIVRLPSSAPKIQRDQYEPVAVLCESVFAVILV